MKRYLVLEFNPEMFGCFVWRHDGNSECMVSVDHRDNTEMNSWVQAIPLRTIETAAIDEEELLACIRGLRISKTREISPKLDGKEET